MATNPFSTEPLRGARGGFPITPKAAALKRPTRWLMVGGAGDVTVKFANSEIVTLPALQPGVLYSVEVTHVTAATATGIVGGD